MRHTHPFGGFSQVRESGLWLSDTTINDVSTSRHGFVPKAPNDDTVFLDGTGQWSTPGVTPSSAAADGWYYEEWGRYVLPNQNTGANWKNLRGYTLTGASSANSHDADGVFLRFGTGATSGNKVQWIATTQDTTSLQRYPEIAVNFKTDSDLTSLRIWVGLFSADPSASDTTGASQYVGFRYSTATSDTNWRCMSRDGTTIENNDSGVAVAADTHYLFRIVCTPTSAKFYIDDVLVATNSTNIPTSTQAIGENVSGTTLTNAIRYAKWSRLWVRHRH